LQFEGKRITATNKKKIIPTIDSKWNKTEIAAWSVHCLLPSIIITDLTKIRRI
jgi:hypothetical protein